MTHILIVSSTFYEDIAEDLLHGATAHLTSAGTTYEVIGVPGALEIPAVIRFAIATGKYDGYVALGCVIRGETSHYDIVCHESARGLMILSMQLSAAIGNGILTVETMEQAQVRADTYQGNKGGHAAAACLQLIDIKRKLSETKPA